MWHVSILLLTLAAGHHLHELHLHLHELLHLLGHLYLSLVSWAQYHRIHGPQRAYRSHRHATHPVVHASTAHLRRRHAHARRSRWTKFTLHVWTTSSHSPRSFFCSDNTNQTTRR